MYRAPVTPVSAILSLAVLLIIAVQYTFAYLLSKSSAPPTLSQLPETVMSNSQIYLWMTRRQQKIVGFCYSSIIQ